MVTMSICDFQVNEMLSRPMKTFIKNTTCFPDRMTAELRKSVMEDFSLSEKLHVLLLCIEARSQTSILYFTRALTNYYVLIHRGRQQCILQPAPAFKLEDLLLSLHISLTLFENCTTHKHEFHNHAPLVLIITSRIVRLLLHYRTHASCELYLLRVQKCNLLKLRNKERAGDSCTSKKLSETVSNLSLSLSLIFVRASMLHLVIWTFKMAPQRTKSVFLNMGSSAASRSSVYFFASLIQAGKLVKWSFLAIASFLREGKATNLIFALVFAFYLSFFICITTHL